MHAILKSGGRSVYIYIYICVCGSVTLRNVNEMRNATKRLQCERRSSTQFCESTCRLSRMAEEDDEDRVRIRRLATLRKRKERERSTDEKRRRERARDADRHRHAVAECSESAAEKENGKESRWHPSLPIAQAPIEVFAISTTSLLHGGQGSDHTLDLRAL